MSSSPSIGSAPGHAGWARPGTVVMITGAYPPDVCGVGDYTDRLMIAAPSSWVLQVERDWSLRAAPGILARLLRRRAASVIVQYPTQGYGWSLIPHLLVIAGKVTGRFRPILALHEFGSLSRKAQLALALASHAASQIVFTTEAERDRACAFRWFSRRVPTSVIGILSNIPAHPSPPPFCDRTVDVAYFGHIRPNKGVEAFLDTVERLARLQPTVRIVVIGEVPNGYEAFGDMVAARCAVMGAETILGLDDEAVADLLANVRILYLPFPDGVSARRGSILAGLGNGALIATRIGTATPDALVPALIVCEGTPADASLLQDALRWTSELAAVLQRAGYEYVSAMLPRDWSHVATLYDDVVRGVSK